MSDEQSSADAMVQREALRLYERYATEVIEGFGFCPWASEARRKGEVRVEVLLGAPQVAATLEAMTRLSDDEQLAIGLLVFPQALMGRVAFQHFAAEVRQADKVRHKDHSPIWAVADFHPDAEPDLENPERLVSYIRRSPDPTLQLVRHRVLDRIRQGDDSGTRFVDPQAVDLTQLSLQDGSGAGPLHARIAARNLQTVQALGVAAVEDRIRDIHADRHVSYRRLGLPDAPWQTVAPGETDSAEPGPSTPGQRAQKL